MDIFFQTFFTFFLIISDISFSGTASGGVNRQSMGFGSIKADRAFRFGYKARCSPCSSSSVPPSLNAVVPCSTNAISSLIDRFSASCELELNFEVEVEVEVEVE